MRYSIGLSVFTLVMLGASPIHGQGWIEPLPGTVGVPTVARTASNVRVSIVNRIAHIEVEEWFENKGGRPAEGDYLYPLPGEAVFSNVSLFLGDEELRGEMIDSHRARSVYEDIVRRNKDPALIELVGNGLVRARVFPIAAGESRKIVLRFTQLLDRSGDALRFQYVAGLRNVSGQGTRGRPDHAPVTFQLVANNQSRFGDPFSPTHQLVTDRTEDRLTVRPEHGTLTGRFTVFLPLAEAAVGITVAAHRPNETESGYFMLTLSPGRRPGRAIARDLTAVIDVSGSMSGTKLAQAKAALRQMLRSLQPQDRFRLLAFSNAVTVHSNQWTAANDANLARAGQWVEQLRADGGTNIDAALTEAFRLPSSDGRLAVVLFVTDGLPSVGEQDPDRIAQRAAAERGGTRVFAFGVGYDVNTYLLDRLSAEGRGATEYVTPGEDVERALGAVTTKITRPVLTDISVDHAPVRLSEVYPVTIPDLFADGELVVFGRYEGQTSGEERLTIRGRRGGSAESFTARVRFPNHQLSNDFIPRLWASRKLGFLTRTVALEGRTDELIREIRDTALRYGLLSEFTSYLVQEPEIVAQRSAVDDRARVDQARPRSLNGGAEPPGTRDARVTGREAVESAKRAQEQRQVGSVAELDAVDGTASQPDESSGLKRVAGRSFRLENGTWTDLLHREGLTVVEIARFSDAYFRLLELAPELESWLSHFDEVLLAGTSISFRITGDPVASPRNRDLENLIRRFRGN